MSCWARAAALGPWAQERVSPLSRAAWEKKEASKARQAALCPGLDLGCPSGPRIYAVHGLPGPVLGDFRRRWLTWRDTY